MFIKYIRLENENAPLQLTGLELYDISFKKLENLQITLEASSTITPGNPLVSELFKTKPEAKNFIEFKIQTELEVSKIILKNSSAAVILVLDTRRQVLFKETRTGIFNLTNPPDYTVILPHTYLIDTPLYTDCINGTETTYATCKAGTAGESVCPPDFIKTDISNLPVKILSKSECKVINGKTVTLPTDWGKCIAPVISEDQFGNQTFGQGTRTRSFLDRKTQERVTDTQTCKHGELIWSDFSACSATGTKTKTAVCIPEENGGEPCNAIRQITQQCKNAVVSEFSDWGACVGTAGTIGVQTRTKTCTPAENGGTECPGPSNLSETRECQNGIFSDWTPYSVCLEGIQTRTRECKVNNGAPCEGPVKETISCSNAVLGEFSEWSKCENGTRSRKRECVKDHVGFGTQSCENRLIETEKCENIWGPCGLDHTQTNENGETQNCVPVVPLGIYTLIAVIFSIVFAILKKLFF